MITCAGGKWWGADRRSQRRSQIGANGYVSSGQNANASLRTARCHMDNRGLATQDQRCERSALPCDWVIRSSTAWTTQVVHDAQGVGGSSPSRPTPMTRACALVIFVSRHPRTGWGSQVGSLGFAHDRYAQPVPGRRSESPNIRTGMVRGPRTCPADHVTVVGSTSSKSG